MATLTDESFQAWNKLAQAIADLNEDGADMWCAGRAAALEIIERDGFVDEGTLNHLQDLIVLYSLPDHIFAVTTGFIAGQKEAMHAGAQIKRVQLPRSQATRLH